MADRVAVPVGRALPLPQWDASIEGILQDEEVISACLAMAPCSDPAAVFLADWLAETAGATTELKLHALQRLFRGIDYRPDGAVDRWTAPLAVFRDRGGDCEDVAIAKYVLLRLLGFPEESLLLLVVWDRKRDLTHALLAVDVGSSTWFLDNDNEPPGRQLSSGYLPLFGLNSQDRWVFADAR